MLTVTSFLKTKMVDFYCYCSYIISWSYQKEEGAYVLNDTLSLKKCVWQYINTNTHIHANTLFSLIQFMAGVSKKWPLKWGGIIQPEYRNHI